MNKQPVRYLQTDSKWSKLPYRVKGETSTIGGSGCGPTAAAMCITTLTGKVFTPKDACEWSVKHGYKALNQGTYYGYFVPQFKEFGISCKQLLGSRLSNNPTHPVHNQVRSYLDQGYYVIALMGPGLWTRSGHFIVVYDWDNKVRINDPASTKPARMNGDPSTFLKQVRNYWLVDARDYNKEDDEMLSYEQWKDYMARYRSELDAAPVPGWAVNSGEWEKAHETGIIADKSRPQGLASRAEVAAMIVRSKNK